MPTAVEATVGELRFGLPDKKNGDLSTNPDSQELVNRLGKAINEYPRDKSYSVALEGVPVTIERLPYIPGPGDHLIDAGTARANVAASNEAPNGTLDDNWARDHSHETVRSSQGYEGASRS